MKKKFTAGFIPFAFSVLFAGCTTSTADLEAVRNFQPEKYMGTWYEIARLPHYFERGMNQVSAEYSLNPDGSIRVVNRGKRNGEQKTIVGKAHLKKRNGKPLNGELRVSFFGPFYSDYRIIELPEDYSYSVVTGGSRNFLWILSRTPTLPDARLKPILEKLRTLGFAVEKLEWNTRRRFLLP